MLCSCALGACSTTQASEPLSDERFEAAKQACGATDAYISEAKGQRGVGFRGVATDFAARQAQALCLKDQLRGTDVRFLGFLSEAPPQ
jgi:hypothetical protein